MSLFLVLEDEPFIAMDLSYAFEDFGHKAVTAVDNAEAMELIEANSLAGAVLDVSLGGGETCDKTADRLYQNRIPFILHTGDLNRVGEHLRGINAPIIAKPRPAEDVVETLLQLMDED